MYDWHSATSYGVYAKNALDFAMNEASLVVMVGGKLATPYAMYPLSDTLVGTSDATIFAVARWSEWSPQSNCDR